MLNIPKKWLVLTFLAVIFLYFIFSFGFVIVQNDEATNVAVNIQKQVATQPDKSNSSYKSIKAKSSTIKLLGRGDYYIKAGNGYKQTIYSKHVAWLLWPSITKVKLSSQLKAISLGKSGLNCAIDSSRVELAIFYRCPRVLGNESIVQSYGSENAVVTKAFPSSHRTASMIYNGKLLTISYTSSRKVDYSLMQLDGSKTTKTGSLSMPAKNAGLDYRLVGNEDTSSYITFYNPGGNSLIIFSSLSDPEPITLSLNDEINVRSGADIKVVAAGNKIYVYSGQAVGGSPEASEEGVKSSVPINNILLVVDPVAGKILRTVGLDNGTSLVDMYGSSAGKVALLFQRANLINRKLFIYSDKLIDVPGFENIGDGLAWINKDSFYFMQNYKIYSYSTSSKSAKLVYDSGTNNVSSLYSSNGQAYFTVVNQDSRSAYHYRLTQDSWDRPRLDGLMPLVFPDSFNIGSVNYFKGVLYVSTIKDGRKVASTQDIVNYLTSNGIESKYYQVKIN